METPSGRTIAVPSEIRPLVAAIRERMKPDSIWLFGSRARGDARPNSDWDIVVALPDGADLSAIDPMASWSLQRETGISATIVTMSVSELSANWGAVNTLGFELARDGRRFAD